MDRTTPPLLCLIVCAVPGLFAQTEKSPDTAATAALDKGRIEGAVLSESNSQPLRRAQVLLRPVEAGNSSLFETTDDKGTFAFPKVTPGHYSITIRRDGFLTATAGRIGAYKMPPIFQVQPGQSLSSFTFRMLPSGVVSGKVKFDDAEPAIGTLIQLFREYYFRGRHGFSAVASARTDDRGEYRVHGLEPGSYYVAALYQPPPRPPNADEERRTDPDGKPLPELNYAVTFYPEVQKLSDAVAVHILPGQEAAGIDIFLTKVHTVRIRGRVISSLSGRVVGRSQHLAALERCRQHRIRHRAGRGQLR